MSDIRKFVATYADPSSEIKVGDTFSLDVEPESWEPDPKPHLRKEVDPCGTVWWTCSGGGYKAHSLVSFFAAQVMWAVWADTLAI